MKRISFALLLLCLFLPAGDSTAEDYFQQFVHYTIRVRLDTEKRMLTGTETIAYTNNSPDTLHKFYLHLYPNGYRSKESALIQHVSLKFNKTFFDLPKKYRSYLNIDDVIIDGTEVRPRIDDTIAEMDLPAPLPPGASMEVSLRFEEKIRAHLGRAGYRGNHYDLAQWYPKVVVYDENGFHPDKFRRGEFYGEFGTFDVHIDTPKEYVIAATGVLVDGDPGWSLNPPDGKGNRDKNKDRTYKTVHFRAEQVHDFAWCADPTFVVQDSTWNDVEIRSFYRKSNKEWRDSTLVHGVRAIQWLEEKVGPYPYPQVSIVDALLSGGMEYPMLVMDGQMSETLVLHEIGHIYFFGIFGNDERAEAWLDEGFTTFQTNWYVNERYGRYGNTKLLNWYEKMTPQPTRRGLDRTRLFPILRGDYGERISTRAEDFKNSYYAMVYWKAGLMFDALRYVVGEDTFDRILKEYYKRWNLKHVNEARFHQVCEEVSGMDLDWFFEQWLHTRKISDYRLSSAQTRASEGGDGYSTRVQIDREGEAIMPLQLEFTFKDGTKETTRIDGRLRNITETYQFPEKPTKIAINPANEIMDVNHHDNFLPRRRAYQIDWPNNEFIPEDVYQVRYRPAAWYNHIDRLKFGLHMRGSHASRWLRLQLGLYYGAESGRLDYSLSYNKRVRPFMNWINLELSAYKMEGRQDFNFALTNRRRKEMIRPPTQIISLGINYHELANSRYVINPETYQERSDVAPFFGYAMDPQFDILATNVDVGLRLGRKWFGGRWKYSRFFFSTRFFTREELVHFDGRLRLFAGFISGSMPFQQKFYLAGGGPLEEEKVFFLRSPGAIWKDANYHQGGHGNLRGYLPGSFGVNRLLAMNLEIGKAIPLLSQKPNRLWGNVKAMAFTDIGRTLDDKNPIGSSARVQALVDAGLLEKTIMDAGVGVRVRRNFPFWNVLIRLDFPFYLNVPELNGEKKETDYRYVFSLTSAF